MTDVVCQRNAFLQEITTVVTSCRPRVVAEVKGKSKSKDSVPAPSNLFEVELKETVLFPEGGLDAIWNGKFHSQNGLLAEN